MNNQVPEEMLEAWLNDELTEEQFAKLETWLRDRSENMRQFVELNVRDQQLREVAKAQAGLKSLAKGAQDAAPKNVIFRFPNWAWIPVAAAAALVIMLNISPEPTSEGDLVATVKSARKLDQFEKGDRLREGQVVHLETGRIAIRFESGARLAVVAPAEFEIVGPNAAKLLRGLATVRVPGKIKGFTLDTPTERVIDLGTSFGVNVDRSGATAISVFEGEIELGAGQRLLAGQSVELAKSHATEIPYTEGDYSETWQISFGIEALKGKVRLAAPSERLIPGQLEDSDSLLLFPEREDVALPKGYAVNATEPGLLRHPFRKSKVGLSKDVRVDSFLLQYNAVRSDKNTENRIFQGELHFDRPIVALVLQAELLDASDALLALPGVDFSKVFRRGINIDDEVTLSPDRRTLRITFELIDGVDQIRVLVASDSPAQSL